MKRRRPPTLRYRCPATDGQPPVGIILMGEGPRVRRAYRILAAIRTGSGPSGLVGLGVVAWKLHVEPMSADAGRAEIAAGVPHWCIHWARRQRRA